MTLSLKRFAAAAAAACTLATLPAHALPIVNGGFESGLAGWSIASQTGSDGGFALQSGTTSPVTGMEVAAPSEGNNAAMTDAEAGGSHVLWQAFTQATAVGSARLRFDLFIGNRADAFYVPDPATLDWATPLLNQQARVDILRGGADPFSLALEDLLLNAFATGPTTPLVSGYNRFEIDITDLLNANLNTSLLLRFSEVDNVNLFQFGVDNVEIEIGEPGEVPEPGSWMLLLAGLTAAGALRRRAGRG